MEVKRIIPCLDISGGRVVKGVNFISLRDAGDPVEIARAYSEQGADEIVFLDIMSGAAPAAMQSLVERLAENVQIPFAVGGGIKTIGDFERMIKTGAAKVSVNTAAVKNPQLIKEAAKLFGSSRVIAAIDAKARPGGGWDVFVGGGRINTGVDALDWAEKCASLGCGEILLTSIDFDGTKSGYDVRLTRAVSERAGVPVIASGGAGSMEHFYEIFTAGRASAALSASLFHFKEVEIKELKQYLSQRGVPVNMAGVS